MIELRWHGRAQQGVVTAAKVLGETALRTGRFVQAFPEFGPERMGAPVKAYNRISDSEIRVHCQVTHPSFVMIADPTLIGTVDVTEGTPNDAVFIINTVKSPADMRAELNLSDGVGKVYTVDASHISTETIGRLMPNTPMLGALIGATKMVELQDLLDNFQENYSKKYSSNVIAGNLSAMKRGCEEVTGEEA
ncbi:MAG: 2-oxoacid:acceptor oxidoreductase family protein [Thermodesulfobacteriota bacterium]